MNIGIPTSFILEELSPIRIRINSSACLYAKTLGPGIVRLALMDLRVAASVASSRMSVPSDLNAPSSCRERSNYSKPSGMRLELSRCDFRMHAEYGKHRPALHRACPPNDKEQVLHAGTWDVWPIQACPRHSLPTKQQRAGTLKSCMFEDACNPKHREALCEGTVW